MPPLLTLHCVDSHTSIPQRPTSIVGFELHVDLLKGWDIVDGRKREKVHKSRVVMPHAEASNFSSDLTKSQGYESIKSSLIGLLDNQTNWVCNLANASSLLWHMFHALPTPSNKVNWAGFYVVDPKDPNQLILGPFHGKVACQTIRIGKGVCGEAASRGSTVRVDDVESWPGHIACDGDSKSEIVVPLIKNGKVVGVLDIDCAELNGFGSVDQQGLEVIAQLLADGSEWS